MTAGKHSKIRTRLIHFRDNLINLILEVNRDKVLNSENGHSGRVDYANLAVELKLALDRIKVSAIDEEGFKVDYSRLKYSPAYEEFRQRCSPQLRAFDPGRLEQHEEKLAFWINLYNALVLDAVIALGVQHSVTEGWLGLLAFFKKAAYNVGGERMSLDDIEHGILRGNRGHSALPGPHFPADDARRKWVIASPDVRIHFALNCASRSCPPIQVYSAKHIDAQLELAAGNFVDQTTSVDQDSHELSISAIFRWYRGDFGGQNGVIKFILNHLPEGEKREWIIENQDSLSLQYKPYDWRLNA